MTSRVVTAMAATSSRKATSRNEAPPQAHRIGRAANTRSHASQVHVVGDIKRGRMA